MNYPLSITTIPLMSIICKKYSLCSALVSSKSTAYKIPSYLTKSALNTISSINWKVSSNINLYILTECADKMIRLEPKSSIFLVLYSNFIYNPSANPSDSLVI
jgi:hypothetical protein